MFRKAQFLELLLMATTLKTFVYSLRKKITETNIKLLLGTKLRWHETSRISQGLVLFKTDFFMKSIKNSLFKTTFSLSHFYQKYKIPS